MFPPEMKLSIILPVLNEEHHGFLKQSLPLPHELIIVDGGSTDNTVTLCRQHATKFISLPNSNRAQRINAGIKAASGKMLLLHHPRSFLEPRALEQIPETGWGGFTLAFDNTGVPYRLLSWWSNNIRAKRRRILYLDHCIFAEKALLQDIPEVDVFEDTLLSRQLRTITQPVLLPGISTTSSVRFRKRFLRQWLKNQVIKTGFFLGIPPNRINRFYERGFWLNSKR